MAGYYFTIYYIILIIFSRSKVHTFIYLSGISRDNFPVKMVSNLRSKSGFTYSRGSKDCYQIIIHYF